MYEFRGLEPVPRATEQLPYQQEYWLSEVLKATNGKEARKPIYESLNRSGELNAETLLLRIALAGNFIQWVQSGTNIQELIDARNGFELFHQLLDDIEQRLEMYEAIFNVTPPEDLENYTNITVNIVERG